MRQATRLQQVERTDRVGVVIPVYGEDDSILRVLGRFEEGTASTICLVVDVPLKREMDRVRAAALKTGMTVHIIKNRERSGVGHCLVQGLKYLQETGHGVAVIMAANGKDDPREIERLVAPVLRGECDYVQGSRYLEGGRREKTPLARQVFNRLSGPFWTLMTGARCTDVTNGFRCYNLGILGDPRINLEQEWLRGYSLEYYIHYKTLALGYRMKEVPVSKTYPSGKRVAYSKIQPLRDWWPIISPLILLSLGVRE